MATYLVTGAAGFIAAKVCEFLLRDGHTVVGLDNLNHYYDVRLKDHRLSLLLNREHQVLGNDPRRSINAKPEEQISNIAKTFIFQYGDIEHLPCLETLFKQYSFDAVFHLAARAGVRESTENPHVYLSTNAAGTLNILECQRKYSVNKLVLASTSSLYAGCPMPFTEDQPVNQPLSAYAASKKAAEMLAYSYHSLYGIDVSVLRYFTVFGPEGRPDMAPFRFIKMIAEGKPITLYGDGNQSRDFTYVDDIAKGTILAAKRLGYEVINIGGGNDPVSLRTIIGWIETALFRRSIVHNMPFQAVDMLQTWADIGRAKALLGWEPSVSPRDGFQLTVESYLRNKDLISNIVL